MGEQYNADDGIPEYIEELTPSTIQNKLENEKFYGDELLKRVELVEEMQSVFTSEDPFEASIQYQSKLAKEYPQEWASILSHDSKDWEKIENEEGDTETAPGYTLLDKNHYKLEGKEFYFVDRMINANLNFRRGQSLIEKGVSDHEKIMKGLVLSGLVYPTPTLEMDMAQINSHIQDLITMEANQIEPTGGYKSYNEMLQLYMDKYFINDHLQYRLIDLLYTLSPEEVVMDLYKDTYDAATAIHNHLLQQILNTKYAKNFIHVKDQFKVKDDVLKNIVPTVTMALELNLNKPQLVALFSCFKPSEYKKIQVVLQYIKDKNGESNLNDLLADIDI